MDFDSSDAFRRNHSNEEVPTIITHPKFAVVELGNYSPSGHNASKVVSENGLAPTVMENHETITGVAINEQKVKKTN